MFRDVCTRLTLASIAILSLWPGRAALSQSLAPVRVTSTVAGNGTNSNTGDGGPALSASVASPIAVKVDRAGNIYMCSATANVVRKIDTHGIITTVAGTGTAGYSGDGGPATSANLNGPFGLAFDINDNLLISDATNQVIRKVDQNGIITTIAGTPSKTGYTGDGGPATSATLHTPQDITVDKFGNLYITDYANEAIRKVDINGNISTIVGNGTKADSGDGSPATSAEIGGDTNVWVDSVGNVYILEYGEDTVRMIDTASMIHTITGKAGTTGYSGDGGPATAALIKTPRGVVGDDLGNIYFQDYGNQVTREINGAGIINTIAGTFGLSSFVGDGLPSTETVWHTQYNITIDSNNTLYVPDETNERIRSMSFNTVLPATSVGSTATQNLFVQSSQAVTPATSSVSPVSPAEFSIGTPGCSFGAQLAANTPCEVPVTFQPAAPGLQAAQIAITDASGNISAFGVSGVGIAPQATFSLGAISTIAGNGTAGNSGATGAATSAQVSAPRGGVVDSGGNIYFADSGNNEIRRIDATTGAISTVAGTGTAGYAGDGAAAIAAQLNAPTKVVLDAAANLYIADTGNNVIRYVNASTGVISTIAGTGTSSYTGDAGPATSATLNQPQGLAVDQGGHIFVADTGNHAIRYFGIGGLISTIAGTGTAGYSGDGGVAASAALSGPTSVSLDTSGNLYVADTGNSVIRRLTAASAASSARIIATVAGQQGITVNAGDGGAATAATLNNPSDVAVDAAGDLYIAAGGQVRLISSATGTISTLAGTGATGNYSGEGGAATSAVIPAPATNLMLDSAGDIVLAATAADRLLKVSGSTPMLLNFGVQSAGTTGAPITFSMLNTGNSALNLTGVTASAGYVLQTSAASACTTTTSLTPGQSCAISVVFSPSSDTGAISGALTLTDNTLNGSSVTQTFALSGSTHPVDNTTTTLSITPAAPVYGQSVNIVATVSNGSSTSLTGTVSFTINGGSASSVTVTNGQATLALPPQAVGSLQVSAVYSGAYNDNASSATASAAVQPAVLTVTASSATMSQGTTPQGLTYTITGFVNGDTSSAVTGAPAENASVTSSSAQGTYPIVITQGTLAAANYTFTFVNGTITVGPPPSPDFTLSVTPTQAFAYTGSSYMATVTLTPLYNYTGTVKLSCTSAPQGLGCAATGPLTGDGGPLTGNAQGTPVWTQIIINSNSSTAENRNSTKSNQLLLAFGAPLCLFGLALSRRRGSKWLPRLLSVLLLGITAAGITSCSSTSTTSAAPGMYQVTVTATDTSTNLSHSTTLTLTFDNQ